MAQSIFALDNRRAIRTLFNEHDKSSVISIFPKPIHEVKHTIQPSDYDIPAGTYDKPAILIIESASWWRDVDPEQPLLEIPCSSFQVAESVVRDFCNSMIACDMGNAKPGLFCMPTVVNADRLKKDIDLTIKYKTLLDEAKVKQNNWYRELVKQADALWARSNNNPLVIADDMRLAARELGLDGKEWLGAFQNVEMVRCIACGSLRNPAYPICATCKYIDPTHPSAKDLKFAV